MKLKFKYSLLGAMVCLLFITTHAASGQAEPPFSDADWMSLGTIPNVNGPVYAMAVSGGNLYVGGKFTMAGGIPATNIAEWTGSNWSPLGSGMHGLGGLVNVTALAVFGANLYAGGNFTTAGGISATNIAQWNGSSWSPVGSGLRGNSVNTLAVSGTNLYVGGSFSIGGGVSATNIAQWNGNSWSALGTGMNGYVAALAAVGTNLYAGGQFTTAGGISANNIAEWNGNSWSPLGLGVNGQLDGLAMVGSNLYAGGLFTMAGGGGAYYIARWNGSSWFGFGSDGIAGADVGAMAVSGTNLYVGGDIMIAGGISAHNIAQWNGSSWSALGSGMNNQVDALAVSGGVLYVGGSFTTAGTNASAYVAEAVIGPNITGIFPNSDGSVTMSLLNPAGASGRVWAATDPSSAFWLPVYTNTTGGAWQFTDTNTVLSPARFYRSSIP